MDGRRGSVIPKPTGIHSLVKKPTGHHCTSLSWMALACICSSKVGAPGAAVLLVNPCLWLAGTAVYLYGTSNCTYDIELDSRPVEVPLSLPYGILYVSENLSSATHSIVLTAHPNQTSSGSQQLAFDQAIFTNRVSDEYVLQLSLSSTNVIIFFSLALVGYQNSKSKTTTPPFSTKGTGQQTPASPTSQVKQTPGRSSKHLIR